MKLRPSERKEVPGGFVSTSWFNHYLPEGELFREVEHRTVRFYSRTDPAQDHDIEKGEVRGKLYRRATPEEFEAGTYDVKLMNLREDDFGRLFGIIEVLS